MIAALQREVHLLRSENSFLRDQVGSAACSVLEWGCIRQGSQAGCSTEDCCGLKAPNFMWLGLGHARSCKAMTYLAGDTHPSANFILDYMQILCFRCGSAQTVMKLSA